MGYGEAYDVENCLVADSLSVQLRHVTSMNLTVFSLNYELTVEALEHSAHSSWHSHESSIQVLPP